MKYVGFEVQDLHPGPYLEEALLLPRHCLESPWYMVVVS